MSVNDHLRLSQRGVEFLSREEGCVLKIYKDQVGKETIGIGHLITPAERGIGKFAKGITLEEAYAILRQDVRNTEAAIAKYVAVPLNQNQFDALVSLCFNCGSAPVRGTLGRMLSVGRYDLACNEFARWVFGGSPPRPLPVLIRRRAAEQLLWCEAPLDGQP